MFELPLIERLRQPAGPALAVALASCSAADLDDDTLLVYLDAARRLASWSQGRLMGALAMFADGHRVEPKSEPDPSQPPSSSSERLRYLERTVRPGGEGTPEIREFAADQVAPVLQVAPTTAMTMLGDALDLRHRLPWVSTGLRGGEIDLTRARMIATGTRKLSARALEKADVDRRLYRSAMRLTPGKLRARIEAVVAAADPEDLQDKSARVNDRLRLGFYPEPEHLTTQIEGELPAEAALRLSQQVTALAKLVRRVEPDAPWQALLARALCLLADPAGLSRLRSRVDAMSTQGPAGGPEPAAAQPSTEPAPPTPVTVVHVHASAATVAGDADDPVDLEGYGPIPWRLITESLTGSELRIVESDCDLAHGHSQSAQYRPSETLGDAVAIRDRTCRFPGCNRPARRCQKDHTIPWPNGPTCPCNLGSLCTKHHRLKTHGDWDLRQPFPGVFVWRSPTRRHYLVDGTGTTASRAA